MVSGTPASGRSTMTNAPTPADQVKDQLQEKASHVVDQTQEKAGQLVEAAKQQTASRLEAQKEQAADSLYKAAHALRQTAEGLRDQQEGTMATLAERVAQQAERGSGYLHTRDLPQLLQETEQFGRTRPLLFAGGALTLGLLGVRFLKSSRRAQQAPVAAATPLLPAAHTPSRAGWAPTPSIATTPPPSAFGQIDQEMPPLARSAGAPTASAWKLGEGASGSDDGADRFSDDAAGGLPASGRPNAQRGASSGI